MVLVICSTTADDAVCMSLLAGLVQVAETDDSPETCFWAKQDLQRVIAEERQWRCKLWSTGELILVNL